MLKLIMMFSIIMVSSAGFRLLFETNFFKKVIGFGLVGHAINLCLLLSGWSEPHIDSIGTPAFLGLNKGFEQITDPLPQALILTAIVISFALMGFLLLFHLISEKEESQ